MDSFPVRRGINLSRTPKPLHQNAISAKEIVFTKPMQLQMKLVNLPVQQAAQLNQYTPRQTHNFPFIMGSPSASQRDRQTVSELTFKQQSPKNGSIKMQIPQVQTQTGQFLFNNVVIVPQIKSQTQDKEYQDQMNTLSTQTCIQERKSIEISQPNGKYIKDQIQPKSLTKVMPISFKNDITQSIPISQIPQIKLLSSPNQGHKLNMIVKQKDLLEQQLKRKAKTQQLWQKQREALLKQIQQTKSQLKQLQINSIKSQEELMTKIASLESQIRLMKGNKNRLQLYAQSNKKIFKSQRQKNQKTLLKISKLMSFEEDLIHAKDYYRLKEELDNVHAQNARLISEHQQYVLQVGQNRKATGQKLFELESQINKLKAQLSDYNTKLESLENLGQQKILSLKLQGEVNYLRKKSEEQVEQLRQKDAQLQYAFNEIQKLTENQNGKIKEHDNVLDEATIRQFNQAIILYQARIADLSNSLAKSQNQAEKNRKTVQLLTTELRKTREDRAINSLRERSNENSLKNEVQMLQKGHFTELDLKNKKICNLEDALQRKTKQISEKDKFIKDFLINRAKSLESSRIDILLGCIKQYFQPQTHLEQIFQVNQVSQ